MTVRRIEVDNDGISVATLTQIELRHVRGKSYLTADAQQALVALFARAPTFENAIGAAERYWQGVSPRGYSMPRLSKGYYAADILHRIDWVRKIVALRDAPENLNKANLEFWIYSAMHLGALLEEAEWRFGQGNQIRLGHKIRVKNREAARQGGKARRENNALRDQRLDASVQDCRTKHPDWKGRTIAANLVAKFGRPFDAARDDDRKKAINALARNIKRREK